MTKNLKAQQKLNSIYSENPDPSKWSKWLKVIIAILSALVGALAENQLSIF